MVTSQTQCCLTTLHQAVGQKTISSRQGRAEHSEAVVCLFRCGLCCTSIQAGTSPAKQPKGQSASQRASHWLSGRRAACTAPGTRWWSASMLRVFCGTQPYAPQPSSYQCSAAPHPRPSCARTPPPRVPQACTLVCVYTHTSLDDLGQHMAPLGLD